jgi:hypothetical protein
VPEHGGAVIVGVRVELNPGRHASQEPRQAHFALAQGQRSQILAIEFQKVERLSPLNSHGFYSIHPTERNAAKGEGGAGRRPSGPRQGRQKRGPVWPQRRMSLEAQMPWRDTIRLILLAVLIAALATAAIKLLVDKLS